MSTTSARTPLMRRTAVAHENRSGIGRAMPGCIGLDGSRESDGAGMTKRPLARRVTPWAELALSPDGGLIAELAADRERAASPLAGLEHWNIGALLGREVPPEAPASFDEMMPLWVGGAALPRQGEPADPLLHLLGPPHARRSRP